jgi:hypothetical protein
MHVESVEAKSTKPGIGSSFLSPFDERITVQFNL